MKSERSLFMSLVWFLLGALICYILLQFPLLKIEMQINVVDALVGLITAGIGLYIADTLTKTHSRNQKLSDYLHSKADVAFDNFYALSEQLQGSSSIQLSNLTQTTQKLKMLMHGQRKIAAAFRLNAKYIDDIESAYDALESFLVNNSAIQSNNLNYLANKSQVNILIEEVMKSFAGGIRWINKIN